MAPGGQALLAPGHFPAPVSVAAHADPVIDDFPVGQEDLRVAPAALARTPGVIVAGIDHAAHAAMRVAPVVGLVVVHRGIQGVAVLTPVAIADRCSEAGADQTTGQIGARIAVAGDPAEHRAEQRARQNRISVRLTEPVGVDKAAAGVVIVIATAIMPGGAWPEAVHNRHMAARGGIVAIITLIVAVGGPVRSLIPAVIALIAMIVSLIAAIIALVAMAAPIIALIATVVAHLGALAEVVDTRVTLVKADLLARIAAILAHFRALAAVVNTGVTLVKADLLARIAAIKTLIARVLAHSRLLSAALTGRLCALGGTLVDAMVNALIGAAVGALIALGRAALAGARLLHGVTAWTLNALPAVLTALNAAVAAVAAVTFLRHLGCRGRLGGGSGDQAWAGQKSNGQNGAGERSDHHRAGPFCCDRESSRHSVSLTVCV